MSAGVRALPDELALICSACGARSVDPLRFSCPDRSWGDDIDHVLVPPEPDPLPWPAHVEPDPDPEPAAAAGAGAATSTGAASGEAAIDPFLRYRRLLYSYRVHRAWGGSDAAFVTVVERLQAAVAVMCAGPFRVTPLRRFDGAALVPGRGPSVVWVKDETGNVSGSHKGRHFMGLALYLSVVELHLGKGTAQQPLAISSCGNAALAASVLARALGRRIEVFVPTDSAPPVLTRIRTLGATVQRCPRVPGQTGDPCQAAFEACVERGAVPFSAQGPSNGLTLDGAATLGYELADQLRAHLRPRRGDHDDAWSIDRTAASPETATVVRRLYVQVGGGALASSVMMGLRRAHTRGVLQVLPALHTVQAEGAAPFTRAVEAVTTTSAGPDPKALQGVLRHLARHRHEAMQPWPAVPFSVAGGIIDDETYDWRSVVEALVTSGGRSVLVSETGLSAANEQARQVTGIDVDCTGSAGLAGVRADAETAATSTGEPVLVLFTGARR